MDNSNLDLGGFNAIYGGLSKGPGGDNKDYDIVDPKEITGQSDDDSQANDLLDDVDDTNQNDDDDNDGKSDDDRGDSSADDSLDDGGSSTDSSDVDGDDGDSGSGKGKTQTDKDDTSQIEGFGELEGDLAEFVQEKIFESFGWEKEDEAFQSMDEVVEFVKKVIDENSEPDYASEEIKRMDEYVRAGGDINSYLDNVHGGLDLDNLDLTRESDQKAIIKENLKLKGYSDARIKRALDRYEDAGTLAEEAEDAEELVKDYNSKIADRLLEDQKNRQEEFRQQQQAYYESVEAEIKGLTNVRGIDISESERRQLLEYIFKPTTNGKTKYQNDYIKSQKNLIESAYFTMKGDKLVNKVQKKASSDATKRLRKKLASKGKRGKDQNIQSSSSYSFLDTAYSQLKKPKY